MKKSFSKILSLALMTALSLSVTGCGSDDATDAYNDFTGGSGTYPTGGTTDLNDYGFVVIYQNVNEAYLTDLEQSYTGYNDFHYETVSNSTTCKSYGFTNYYADASYDGVKTYISDDYMRSCMEIDSSGDYYSGSSTVVAYYNY